MSGSVNKVILVGNLGKDPDIRKTQDGRPVVSFSVATGESWKDKTTGERKERTDWHQVVIFNEGLCKIAEQYLKKGSKVYLEGAQMTRKWTDKDGRDHYVTETVLQAFRGTLTMLDRAERAPGASAGDYGSGDVRDPAPPSDGAPAGPNAAGSGKRDDMDDEIPF